MSIHTTFQNKYTHKIATDTFLCFVCYKETNSVLTTPGDFFYICSGHLLDASFCSPIFPSNNSDNSKNEKQKESNIEKNTIIKEQNPSHYVLNTRIFYLRQKRLHDQQRETKTLDILKQLKTVPKK